MFQQSSTQEALWQQESGVTVSNVPNTFCKTGRYLRRHTATRGQLHIGANIVIKELRLNLLRETYNRGHVLYGENSIFHQIQCTCMNKIGLHLENGEDNFNSCWKKFFPSELEAVPENHAQWYYGQTGCLVFKRSASVSRTTSSKTSDISNFEAFSINKVGYIVGYISITGNIS